MKSPRPSGATASSVPVLLRCGAIAVVVLAVLAVLAPSAGTTSADTTREFEAARVALPRTHNNPLAGQMIHLNGWGGQG